MRSDEREHGTERTSRVRHPFLLCIASASMLAACSHDPFRKGPGIETRTMVGVGAGAAIGAVAGPSVGVDPVTGAAAGAVVGGAVGALVKGPNIKRRQYYKDTRGYCYYVDARGKTKHAPKIKC